MAFIYGKKRSNPPQKRLISKGWPEGWNALPHASSLKDTELADFINGVYSQYGSLSKRLGSMLLGATNSDATSVIAGGTFYNIGGADYTIRVTSTGTVEQYSYTTGLWTLLTGTTPSGYAGTDPEFVSNSPVFHTDVHLNVIQANGKIYFASETDRVTIFDGTAWSINITLADPSTKPTVVKTGSGTGTRSYFYRYTWLNDSGTTLASGAVTTDAQGTGWYGSMPVIDGSTYLTLTLPSAPTGAAVTAIYRGDVSGKEFYLETIPASQTTYIDKNVTSQSNAFAVPADNTTVGYHFYLLEVYQDTLVGTTVEEGKDILVWSAGTGIALTLNDPRSGQGTFDSFALTDGAGFDDYSKGDGQTINAIQPFSVANEDGLAVFKDARVGLLKFDANGGGNVQNVNVTRGTMAPGSPHVAGNEIRFYSQEGVASFGHAANFGTILRYTVLSLKASSITDRVTPANLPYICSEYYKNLSIFAISTGEAGAGNDSMIVYDERYNTWSYWTGLHASIMFKGIHPTIKVETLYFGTSKAANQGGAIVEMFKGKTDYATSTGSGTKISLSITTKQYDAGFPDKFKKYDKAVLIFGSLFGNNTTIQALYMDTNGLSSFPRLRIATDPVLSGFGNDEWGDQEVGMMTEDNQGETLNIRYVPLRQKDLFWVKLNLQNDGVGDDMTLIGVAIYYSDSQRQLPAKSRLVALA